MARKVFRTVQASPADAGSHDEHLYDKALNPLRATLRRWLLPSIRTQTPALASIQAKLRSPLLDLYFVWTANLGTHTFFMVGLPLLFWFGYSELGRALTTLTAFGVYWCAYLKDFLCLPRPLSPPLHRLSMSSSTKLEYGFPSTHSANSVAAAFYLLAVVWANTSADDWILRIAATLGLLGLYAGSIVWGRIHCGMHSFTDVIGGSVIGMMLFYVQWTWRAQFEALITGDSYLVLLIIPICLILVGIHPDPVDRCPCFEDSVCFMAVIIGLIPGSWAYAHSPYAWSKPIAGTVPFNFEIIGLWKTVFRVVFGVTILFGWRLIVKRLCYLILPPIYSFFNLPHRNFEVPARTYRSLAHEAIHPVPSVLSLPNLSNVDHVGPQDSIDLREAASSFTVAATARHVLNADEEVLLVVEDAPLRYDVDIVTKLIVYAGIGWLAVYAVPVLFELFGLGVGVREVT